MSFDTKPIPRTIAVFGANAHIGNFVELKKARIGAGSKAGHLAYLGDADIGEQVNIGAGTITCNYDGVLKHRTEIGDGAFVGSNSTLVAPLNVGEKLLGVLPRLALSMSGLTAIASRMP